MAINIKFKKIFALILAAILGVLALTPVLGDYADYQLLPAGTPVDNNDIIELGACAYGTSCYVQYINTQTCQSSMSCYRKTATSTGAPRCINQCITADQRQCSGNGYQQCYQSSDGCLYWQSITACSSNQTWINGSCTTVTTCQNECVDSQRRCTSNGYQVCARGNDGCYRWDGIISCGQNQTCINGNCTAACQNECNINNYQCSGASSKICRYFDNNCTRWDGYQNCDSRCYRCGDGRCDSECDETRSACPQDCGSPPSHCKKIIANAGPDKEISPGDSITLDGSINYDYDYSGYQDYYPGDDYQNYPGSPAYAWSCSGGELSDSNTLRPVFYATPYQFQSYYYLKNDDYSASYDQYKNYRPASFTCTLTASNKCGSSSNTMYINVTGREYISPKTDAEYYPKKYRSYPQKTYPAEYLATLSANPNNSCAPLYNVSLTARIDDSNASNYNYTYNFDCGGGLGGKVITTTANSYTAANLCQYRDPGTYTATICIDTQGQSYTARQLVTAINCATPKTGSAAPPKATYVATGITNDPFRDSFAMPLVLIGTITSLVAFRKKITSAAKQRPRLKKISQSNNPKIKLKEKIAYIKQNQLI